LRSTLRAMQKILEESVDEKLKAIHMDVEASDLRLQRMEVQLGVVSKSVEGMDSKVEEIAQAVGIDKQDASAGDDEEDRKRIKERLREALEKNYERTKRNTQKKSFMEYFFGICKTNGRVGKIGSRFGFMLNSHFAIGSEGERVLIHGRLIHPQSAFMQGCPPASSLSKAHH
jgi:hypothetical protein